MAAITAARVVPGDPEATTRAARHVSVSATVGAVVTLLVFLIAVRPAVDNDLWFHLRTARWMLDHHDWVGVDPFTHTRPGVARVQTDWLAQLAYYGVWRVAGLTGVALLVAGVASAAMALLYRTLTGPVAVRAGVVLLTAAASSIFWSARTQMATFLGTVVVVALVQRWRTRPDWRGVWWLVPVFAVWVNAHGGVAYGLLILGATVVGESINLGLGRRALRWAQVRRLAVVGLTCGAVLVLNPSGWRVYGLPFHQVDASVRFVQEYQPPSLGEPAAAPFFLLLALTIGLVTWHWRELDAVEVLLVGGSALFALQFTRSIPFFAVVAAPVVARHLSASIGGRATTGREPAPRGLVTLAALLAVVVVGLTAARLDSGQVDERMRAAFPVAATAWLNDHRPPGELFNTFDWGGYLMWEAPQYRVSIDGRTDVYDEHLNVYDDTIRALPGWQDELGREGIGTVLVDTDAPLADALRAEPGWELAYQDEVAAVFVRDRR